MLNPHSWSSIPGHMLDYARGLSLQGIEDLHIRLLSKQANKRKALLAAVDELIDVSAEAQIVGLLRGSRTLGSDPPPLLPPRSTSRG